MAVTIKQVKEYLNKEIKNTKDTRDGFDINEGYEWEVATLDGEINALENVLTWIKRQEK